MAISIDKNALLDAIFVPLYETSITAAKRMEQEAKMTLQENIHGPKTSGTLMDSIKGFVTVMPKHGLVIGVSASAVEKGQWERSQGEIEEADSTAGTGDFNYATAVEEGTGIFGSQNKEIRPRSKTNMRFWTGENIGNEKDIIHTNAVLGQPGKHFLDSAIKTSAPFIEDLFNHIGMKVDIKRFVK